VCKQAVEFLNVSGFYAASVLSAPSAISHLKDQPVDIVLLDVDMPDYNGYDVCRQIRTLEHGATVPILVFTQCHYPEAVDQSFLAGATDFTTKPNNWFVLPHRIRNMLRSSDILEALGQSRTSLDAAQCIAGLGNWEYIIGTGVLIWSDNIFRILDLEPQSHKSTLSLYMKYVHESDRPKLHAWLSNDDTKSSSTFKHRLITEGGDGRQLKVQVRTEYDSSGCISRK
jgi:CheY-like chemotaxis protein